jgi:hypothetical protein
MTPVDRLDSLLAEPVSTRSLGLIRLLVGLITLVHLWPFVSDGLDGNTYHDRFHHPYLAILPDLPPTAYTVLMLLAMVSALAMAAGFVTRLSTAATFVFVAYNLALSTTHLHNNRAYLVTVLLVLALAPCGRSFSIDAWLLTRSGGTAEPNAPGWTLWMLRFVSAVTYGASGLSKLTDPDWFGGQVTWGRVVVQEAMVRDSLLPSAIADMLLDRSFHTVAAKAVVLTELLIAAGLWSRSTRRAAVVAAAAFHVVIEFSAEVQIFSYLGLTMLLAWANPSLPWLGRVRAGAIDRRTTEVAEARP